MEGRGSKILGTVVGKQKRLVMGAKFSECESTLWGGGKEFRRAVFTPGPQSEHSELGAF